MTDLLYWCPTCRDIAVEVVGDDRAARDELARSEDEHKAWHRAQPAEAHGVTL